MNKEFQDFIITPLERRGVRVQTCPEVMYLKNKLDTLKFEPEKNKEQIKKLQVLKTSYNQVFSLTGRVFPKYKMAKNYRWMTSSPNLQALTKASGPNSPRSKIIPEDNHYLASFDVSQGDIRILAHFLKKQSFTDIINEDEGDIHTTFANKLNMSRQKAKTMIFALLYGSRPLAIAKKLDCTYDMACTARERVLKLINPEFKEFTSKLNTMDSMQTELGSVDFRGTKPHARLPLLIATGLACYIQMVAYHFRVYCMAPELAGKIFLYLINHDELIFCVENSVPYSDLLKLKKKVEQNIKINVDMKFNLRVSKTNYDVSNFVKVNEF